MEKTGTVCVESAFRLFVVHSIDWGSLVMKWPDSYYFDKVLSLDRRRTLSLFNHLSDALEWVLCHKFGISYVCNGTWEAHQTLGYDGISIACQ